MCEELSRSVERKEWYPKSQFGLAFKLLSRGKEGFEIVGLAEPFSGLAKVRKKLVYSRATPGILLGSKRQS